MKDTIKTLEAKLGKLKEKEHRDIQTARKHARNQAVQFREDPLYCVDYPPREKANTGLPLHQKPWIGGALFLVIGLYALIAGLFLLLLL